MSTDFGADIATPGLADLDPHFAFSAGAPGVGEALGRRLVTARGSLLDDPGYGYDLRAHINDDTPPTATIAAAVVEQLKADERVLRARVAVTFTPETETLSVVASVVLAEGPFRLTVSVSAVTTTFLFEAAP